mmetsp:Transcript_25164/g.77646  ORF Transcript_25164/g.77646 Transcript_25164/m.77646 type:complete len:92 (-) Transcript_25164:168-443(-)
MFCSCSRCGPSPCGRTNEPPQEPPPAPPPPESKGDELSRTESFAEVLEDGAESIPADEPPPRRLFWRRQRDAPAEKKSLLSKMQSLGVFGF